MRWLVIIFLVLIAAQNKANAHPHAWIDLETALIFNKQGHVSGLRVGWLFDDFYSAFSMEGLEPTQERLNELAQTNLGNLKGYNYFTDIRVDGVRQEHGPVTTYATELVGNRLWMEFVVPLTKAVDPKTHDIVYSVYDPTYYVEILHVEKGDPIRFEGAADQNCTYALKPPQPPQDVAMLAAAMDKSETPSDVIGNYFAEKVVLSCR